MYQGNAISWKNNFKLNTGQVLTFQGEMLDGAIVANDGDFFFIDLGIGRTEGHLSEEQSITFV